MKIRIAFLIIIFSLSQHGISQNSMSYNITKIDTVFKDDKTFYLVSLEPRTGKAMPNLPQTLKKTYDTKFEMQMSLDSACKLILLSLTPSIGIVNEDKYALSELEEYIKGWINGIDVEFYYKNDLVDCDIIKKSQNKILRWKLKTL